MEKNQVVKAYIDYIKEGNKLKGNGQFESAIASYKKAIEANPRFSWSYFYVGETLAKLKKLDEAVEAYNRAIEFNPNLACFHSSLGKVLKEKRQVNEELKHDPNVSKTEQELETQKTSEFKAESYAVHDEKFSEELADLKIFNSINYKGQLLQDKWVIMMTKGKQKGVFLEVGSTDGVGLNNTFCLEKTFSWSGICVEPNPDFYKKLCLNRTAITLPYAFYKESAQIVEFINNGVLGTITEFSSSDHFSLKREKFVSERGTIKVITACPEDVLNLYKFPKYFDFFSLDVEGAELDVLESFNLSKWLPALMCVEHNCVNDKRLAIFKLLSSHGYQRIECKWDDWYYNLSLLEILNPKISLDHYQQVLEYFCQYHDCKFIDEVNFQAPKNLVKENVNNPAVKKTHFKLAKQVDNQINDNELVNIAIGKKAFQSSYSQWSKPDDSMRAVNGLKNGKFSFCTEIEEKPWWMVDLGNIFPIELVKIFNREDCASERVKGMEILFSLDSKQWRKIAVINYPFGGYISGEPLTLDFRDEWARFVKLQLQSKNYLHLDEVEIFLSQEALRVYDICKALNFDYSRFAGTKFQPTYTIQNSALLLRRVVESTKNIKIDALEIIGFGRFGNSIHQLINAFYFCEKYQVPKIYTRTNHPYINLKVKTSQNQEIMLVQGKPGSKEVVLSGMFFDNKALNLKHSCDEYVNTFDKYVLPNVKLPDSPIKVSETDLVIHFRSGDIFHKSTPHSLYGQPPLSFYLKVIESEKLDRCILVFEDKGNVCIGKVENFLKNVSIPFVCQSSSDVSTDISCLKKSVNLIVARGTFGNAITLLANNLKKVYFFEDLYNFQLALARGAKVYRVYDKSKEFKNKLLRNNWKNTTEQKEMMLSYDGSNLGMENLQ